MSVNFLSQKCLSMDMDVILEFRNSLVVNKFLLLIRKGRKSTRWIIGIWFIAGLWLEFNFLYFEQQLQHGCDSSVKELLETKRH